MAGVRDRVLNPKFANWLGSLESSLQQNLPSLRYLIMNKTRLTGSMKISFLLLGKLCWEPNDAQTGRRKNS